MERYKREEEMLQIFHANSHGHRSDIVEIDRW